MRRYGDHFHRKAVISFVNDGKVDSSFPRDRFVMLQTAARARAKGKSVERMTSFTADEDGVAATVVAQWELTKETGDGKKVERGVDRFTLMRDERGKWKIVALIFYETE
jgi:2-C-methyl-D-erythritol 4-phosphate cytidylyltransferase